MSDASMGGTVICASCWPAGRLGKLLYESMALYTLRMSKLTAVRFPDELSAAVDAAAAEQKCSKTELIISAVRSHLGARGLPIMITTKEEALQVPRVLSKKPVIEQREPVLVAPTADNIPGGPRLAKKFGKAERQPRAASQMRPVRVLPGDDEARAEIRRKMDEIPDTPEQQRQPTADGLYKECPHGRNEWRCLQVRCKMETNR